MALGTDRWNKGMQMISFSLGEEELGVDIQRVKKVIRIGEITQ
jgi:chemotaxis signal transduction protein